MFPVGNNLNRGHIYFQDFWKCFSIFNKAQQLQLNRKNRNKSKKEREGSYLGLTCAGPAHLARPSRLALPVVVLLAPEGRGARGRRPRPHAGHLLLLPTSWRRSGMPRDPHVPLSSSLTLPSSPSPSPAPWPTSLSPSHRRSRALRHPLASLTCPEAPP